MTWLELQHTPIGDIVARDTRAGAIFDRYGLDYCCGGARTLDEGCRQKGIDFNQVAAELEMLPPESRETVEQDPIALIGHIVTEHHAYVRYWIPVIQRHLEKVASVHGFRHGELGTIELQFKTLADELSQHMMKEERVLFPYICALAESVASNLPPPPDMFGTVRNPIRMMESEHEAAGESLQSIRNLTLDYRPPADACGTYRLVLRELEAFEKDLHRHVHLENNVLFPRAVELEEKAVLISRGLKCESDL